MKPEDHASQRIDLEPGRKFTSYVDWQSLYMDQATGWLIPSTEIYAGGTRVLRINSLGCKGNEPVPGVPVVGFFGDSTTMCVGDDSWARRVSIAGCQMLNAGIEGHNLESVLTRYHHLRQRVPFSGLVFYVGWHNIIYGRRVEAYWRNKLDEIGSESLVACCTLATCLRTECRERGLAPLLSAQPVEGGFSDYAERSAKSDAERDTCFNFWDDLGATPAKIAEVLDGVARFNAFLKRYCAERGWVLIDLHALMLPASYDEITRDFFDVCHPRAHTYPKIASAVQTALAGPMRGFLAAKTAGLDLLRVSRWRGLIARAKPQAAGQTAEKTAVSDQFYPIW